MGPSELRLCVVSAAFHIDSKDVHTYARNWYDLTTKFPTPVKTQYQEPTYVMVVDKNDSTVLTHISFAGQWKPTV